MDNLPFFNRPGLAGAVLQAASSLTEILTQCLPPVMSHVSHVTCHMSHVTSHVSGVTCHMSNFIFLDATFLRCASLEVHILLTA